jgi:hypothetical protein
MQPLSRGIALAFFLVASACTGGRTEPHAPAVETPSPQQREAPSAPEPSTPTAAAQPLQPAKIEWQVTAQGVGPLALDASVPEPAGGYEAAYTTSFYADAQPLEGFAFADPPALAYVGGGPFAKWGYDHPGEPVPAQIKTRAVTAARAGKLRIDMIVITDPRAKTASGIGVGDAYSAIAARHPGAELQQLPGLWEEPSCAVSEGGVFFFFDACKTPERAKLIRMVVRTDDQGQDTPSRETAASPRKPKGEAKKKASSHE